MPEFDRIVVIGASLAGLRAAEALRTKGFRGELVMVGAEPHPPYNRPPLSKRYLAENLADEDVALAPVTDLRARWLLGVRARALDTTRRVVLLDDDSGELSYDGLVIATGAAPRRLPGAGATHPRTHMLRSLDDARSLRAALSARPRHVVVIGAGFIGSEVASTARRLGMAVTLIDASDRPMAGPLGADVAAWLAEQHRVHGVRTLFGNPVSSVDTDGAVRVTLADGTAVTGDLLVAGLGAVPNTDWLRGSGLRVENGVLTDAALFAADDVVVAGDIARYPHPLSDMPVRVEHWSNAVETARVAAVNLVAGRAAANPVTAAPTFWTDQHGHKIQSVGLPDSATESTVLEGSPDRGRFIVGFGRDGALVGAVAVNAPRSVLPLRRAVEGRAPFPTP